MTQESLSDRINRGKI